MKKQLVYLSLMLISVASGLSAMQRTAGAGAGDSKQAVATTQAETKAVQAAASAGDNDVPLRMLISVREIVAKMSAEQCKSAIAMHSEVIADPTTSPYEVACAKAMKQILEEQLDVIGLEEQLGVIGAEAKTAHAASTKASEQSDEMIRAMYASCTIPELKDHVDAFSREMGFYKNHTNTSHLANVTHVHSLLTTMLAEKQA